MTSIDELCLIAFQCHQGGDLDRAEHLYRQILQADPLHADAHHLLGVLAHQAGRYDLATTLIRHALTLNPLAWAYYCNLGLAQDAQGQTEDAIESYSQAIRLRPDCAEAHSNLANAFQKRGNIEEALVHGLEALHLRLDFPDAHNSVGNALQSQGKFAEAVAHFRQALRSRPKYAEAQNNLGYALHQLGNMTEATEHYRQALQLNPQFPEALCNLGLVLRDQLQMEEAIHCYEQALRIRPAYLEVLNNLGNVLVDQGRVSEGIEYYRRAMQVNPEFAPTHFNLGNAMQAQGLFDEAASCYEKALLLKPDFAEAHNNLGNVLGHREKWDEAIGRYCEFLRLKPDNPIAHTNVGRALAQLGKHSESLNFYRTALKLNPKDALAHCSVGDALAALHELEQAVACYQGALQLQPDSAVAFLKLGSVWLDQARPETAVECLQKALKSKPDLIEAQHNLLFSLNHHPQVDQDEVFAEHRRWGQRHIYDAPTHDNNPDPDRRLRIGYVSPDFRQHALNRYLQPVLTHHDPNQVEVFCYSEVKNPDATTSILQRLAHGWRSTRSLSDEKVADQIRSDRIDILVDLAGHTSGNRLGVFARKPAPIQATWLGYLNTTGLTTVDYRITDEILDPPGQPVRDTEQIMRLPGGFCCFSPPPDAPAVRPLPAARRGYLTFGSLHSIFKLNAKVLDLWSEVLRAMPTSRLVIFRDTLVGTVVEHMSGQFSERGITADRLDLCQGSTMPAYLQVYDEIDVSLDVFPWTGGVTTCESLWMGVPMLSLAGIRPAQRNSAAILANVGLNEWAVKTPEQFVAKATGLPAALDQLAKLRMELRDRMAKTICDAPRFTHILEVAYRTMWQRWCQSRER